MEKRIEEFRDGIFALNTRRFGKVAELMIKQMFKFEKSDNLAYDLKTLENQKIEVKFSTVLRKCDFKITAENLIESVLNANIDVRMLTFDEAHDITQKSKFDCNIQQIKKKEFEYLYYGCFFADKIMICRMDSETLKEDTNIYYSDHQHRGNIGEGQFHITEKILDYHLNEYFLKWLSYEELYNMFIVK